MHRTAVMSIYGCRAHGTNKTHHIDKAKERCDARAHTHTGVNVPQLNGYLKLIASYY